MGEMQDGTSQFEGYERAVELRLILGVAEVMREEFGVGIDAHPGGVGNEAGAINRAFRAAARVILEGMVPSGDDLQSVLAWALQRAASLRLAELGLGEDRIALLLASEPGLGDRWWAYLAMSPASCLADLP